MCAWNNLFVIVYYACVNNNNDNIENLLRHISGYNLPQALYNDITVKNNITTLGRHSPSSNHSSYIVDETYPYTGMSIGRTWSCHTIHRPMGSGSYSATVSDQIHAAFKCLFRPWLGAVLRFPVWRGYRTERRVHRRRTISCRTCVP